MKTNALLLTLMLFTIGFSHKTEAMIFKSDNVAAQWDTWGYYHEGTYYLYYLITEYGAGEGFGVATSTDGVHWQDHGWAIHQSERNSFYLGTGSVWKSPDFDKTGKFICNYSEHRKDESGRDIQNILFAWSTDLIHWNKYDDATMFKIDTDYYRADGRWDCIFSFPRDEEGYWGTWTATSNIKDVKGVGIGYTKDGLKWKALPMAISEPGVYESGAIYPINGRYYGMFGQNRKMLSFTADEVGGPYKQSEINGVCLQAGPTYFSRFLPTDHGLLVNHHSMSGTYIKLGNRRPVTYAAPFKRAEVDDEGVMRWKYWEGNEALKGVPLPVITPSRGEVQFVTHKLDFNKGIVVEMDMTLPDENEKPVTLVFKAVENNYAVRFNYNGVVEMGTMDSQGNHWKRTFGVNREWDFGKTVSARILARAGMLEVYLDDHFMECWTMGCHGAKTVEIGFIDNEAVKNMQLWQMSLEPAKAPGIVEPLKKSTTSSQQPRSDIIIGDFEGGTYGDWTVEGEAFGTQPARGHFKGQGRIHGFEGKGLANSFLTGDELTGKLISPPFKIERNTLNFLIGGGNSPGKACLNVLVAGQVVGSVTGINDDPLNWQSIDLSKWIGRLATIEIVDNDVGGWGHINVDHIVLTNNPKIELPQKKELVLTQRYLNVPILYSTTASRRKVTVKVNGQILGVFSVALATKRADCHAFLDLSQYQGQKVTIEVDRLSRNLDHITLDNHIKGAENLYQEKFRPQFHFTTRRGWINDPNGLVYYKGVYHLYYQYNPFGIIWGNMSWGHAVSKDLIHWRELPAVMYPNEKGMAFTGAAFVDKKNELGLKTGDEDPLIFFYLRTGSGLSYAYSTDRGRTFQDYSGNPVLAHAGARIDSPKPFWHEPTQRWVAPTFDHFLDDEGKRQHTVAIYSSADLKEWKFESRMDRMGLKAECPDLFELAVDGNPQHKKWVLVFVDGTYCLGDFDGHTLYTQPGQPAMRDDCLTVVYRGNYSATMTWSDIPKEDGRRIQKAWMIKQDREGYAVSFNGMPFNQQMTIPLELSLRTTEKGPRLFMYPVREVETLRQKTHTWNNITLTSDTNPLAALQGKLYDIEVEFAPGTSSETVFDLRSVKVRYDAESRTLSCNNVKAPLKTTDGAIRLRILIDRSSIEVFGNDGRVYIPLCIMLPEDNLSYSAATSKGMSKVKFLRVHELKSIWKEQTIEK